MSFEPSLRAPPRQVEIILEARAEELHPGDAVAAVLRELQSLAVEDEVVHARDDAVGSGLGVDERHHLRDAVFGLRNRLGRCGDRLDERHRLAEDARRRSIRAFGLSSIYSPGCSIAQMPKCCSRALNAAKRC